MSAAPGQTIQAFATDEHALTLGINTVTVIMSGGTSMTPYPFTASPLTPACVDHPSVGSTAQSGDQAGTDTGSRPMWPALFVTDITADPSSRSCDWQQVNDPSNPPPECAGAMPISPSGVCGVWKAAAWTVNTVTNTVVVAPGPDPSKKNQNLGVGADPIPPGTPDLGYGTEARWSVDDLKAAGILRSGHTYCLQFMVHDGDQNKTGGDVGEACVNLDIP
jgi:hypothetical protein